MNALTEERSVSDFQQHMDEYVGELKRTKNAMLLTRDGEPELVVQDAATYLDLLDRLEDAETVAAIARGIDDADNGRVIPLHEVSARLRAKYGL